MLAKCPYYYTKALLSKMVPKGRRGVKIVQKVHMVYGWPPSINHDDWILVIFDLSLALSEFADDIDISPPLTLTFGEYPCISRSLWMVPSLLLTKRVKIAFLEKHLNYWNPFMNRALLNKVDYTIIQGMKMALLSDLVRGHS